MKHILALLAALMASISSFFKDKHEFFDEKKILGTLWLVAPLVAIFVLPFDPVTTLVTLLIGVGLFLGVPIGELVPPVTGLQGMGLFDLITNKANKGDPYRLLGAMFLITGLTYLYFPFWSHDFHVHWEYLLLLGLTGLSLLGVAIVGDKVAVPGPQWVTGGIAEMEPHDEFVQRVADKIAANQVVRPL